MERVAALQPADGLRVSEPERAHLRLCLAVSAFLFLVCAVFSFGFDYADEYFQTVEFASAKLSITDPAELAWEYRAQMRPWLQPAIYVGVLRVAGDLGVHRPMTLLFLLRLLSAAVAWTALWSLVLAGRHWIDDEADRGRLYSITAFLWLLPYLGVRTGGETFSTASLCFAIALLEWRSRAALAAGAGFWPAVLAGLGFGLCFEFRYGSVIMAAGAALFYLRQDYMRRSEQRLQLFAGLLAGGIASLIVAAAADYWGYGSFEVPAANYFYQNFVLGRSKDHGTAPFFAYLYLPLATPMAPLVLPLFAATLIAWVRRANSVLTWASAPYVAILCIPAHKEARFLYPLAPFLPFFVIFATERKQAFAAQLSALLRWLTTDWRLVFANAMNMVALLVIFMFPLPADFWPYRLMETESFAAGGAVDAVVVRGHGKRPYWTAGLHMAFIEPKNLHLAYDPTVADLDRRWMRGERFFAFVDIPVAAPAETEWIRGHCEFLRSSWPRWLEPYNFAHWQDRAYWWELYRCQRI